MTVIETVRYNVKPGVTTEQAIAAWHKSQSFARAQPGFLGRRLLVSEDGQWLDMVEWDTMENAKAAGAAFDPGKYPDLLDLVTVLAEETMEMRHYITQAQV